MRQKDKVRLLRRAIRQLSRTCDSAGGELEIWEIADRLIMAKNEIGLVVAALRKECYGVIWYRKLRRLFVSVTPVGVIRRIQLRLLTEWYELTKRPVRKHGTRMKEVIY